MLIEPVIMLVTWLGHDSEIQFKQGDNNIHDGTTTITNTQGVQQTYKVKA